MTNTYGLAHFLTIPRGVWTIRVTAQLPETGYNAYAYGAIIGGAQARSMSLIEVWDKTSRRLCRVSKVHADVWALIAAGFYKRGQDTIPLECTFSSPGAGRDVVIKFISRVFTQAWGLGSGSGYAKTKPADIRIDLIS